MVFEEIEALRSGKSTPARMNAITSGLGLVVNTAKLELEWAKTMNKKPDMEFYEVSMDVSPSIPEKT